MLPLTHSHLLPLPFQLSKLANLQHHVEVHDDVWWRAKFESQGLVYSEDLTKMVRETAKDEQKAEDPALNGDKYNAQHIWTSMQVFINPPVASLPDHAHLFAESGCYMGRENGAIARMPCGQKKDGSVDEVSTAMDPEFLPLVPTKEQDEEWEKLVRASLKSK